MKEATDVYFFKIVRFFCFRRDHWTLRDRSALMPEFLSRIQRISLNFSNDPDHDMAFSEAARACPQVKDVFVYLEGSRDRTQDAPNLSTLPKMLSVTTLFIESTEEHGHLLRCMTRLLEAVPNVQDLSIWVYEEESHDIEGPRDTACIHAGATQTPIHLSKLERFTKIGFEVEVFSKDKRGKKRHRHDEFDEFEDDEFLDFGGGNRALGGGLDTADHLDKLLTPNSFRTVKYLTIDSINFLKTCSAITKSLAENVSHVTLHLPELFYGDVGHVLKTLGSLSKLRTIDARQGLEIGEIDSLKTILESVPAGVETLKMSLNRKQLLETIKQDPFSSPKLSGKRLSQLLAYPHRSFFGSIDETKDAAELERVDEIVDSFKNQGLAIKFCA